MSKRGQNALLAVVASVLLAPAPAVCHDTAYPRAAIVTPASAGDSVKVVLPPGERDHAIVPSKLPKALLVYAAGAGPGAPMAGVYAIEDGHIRFTPRFPLRRGVAYQVAFDSDCLFDAFDGD